MKRSILSYISFVLVLVLIILEVIITNKYLFIEGLNMRKTLVIISYFIHLPLFIINLILTVKIFLFCYRGKFQNHRRDFYLILPSLLFYFSWLVYLIYGITN